MAATVVVQGIGGSQRHEPRTGKRTPDLSDEISQVVDLARRIRGSAFLVNLETHGFTIAVSILRNLIAPAVALTHSGLKPLPHPYEAFPTSYLPPLR